MIISSLVRKLISRIKIIPEETYCYLSKEGLLTIYINKMEKVSNIQVKNINIIDTKGRWYPDTDKWYPKEDEVRI